MAKKIIEISQTPTIDTNAYSAGDIVGTLLTFENAANGGGSKVLGATILDKAGQKKGLDLVLFNQSVTPANNNAAAAFSAADAAKACGHVSIVTADYSSLAASTNAIATKRDLNMACAGSQNNHLYGVLIAREAATHGAADGLVVKLLVEIED